MSLTRRLHRWAHRKGLARQVSSTYSNGWQQSFVDTGLPVPTLAIWAHRRNHPDQWAVRVVSVERLGRWRWRYVLGREGPVAVRVSAPVDRRPDPPPRPRR